MAAPISVVPTVFAVSLASFAVETSTPLVNSQANNAIRPRNMIIKRLHTCQPSILLHASLGMSATEGITVSPFASNAACISSRLASATAVVTAATDPKPKLRYTAGSGAGRVSMLRRLVPARIFDKQIRKINRMA